MKFKSTWTISLAATAFALAMRCLFATLRLDRQMFADDIDPYDPATKGRYLYSVWHDLVVIAAFGGKQPYTVALTSRHQNGGFVTGVVKAIGMPAVRGSTSRGGAAAIRELITVAKTKHIVISPDGPRGPRRQMSQGIVFLASQTGRPIVPTGFACSRAWKINGRWTDLVIPKPFAKVSLLAGAPIVVPPDCPREELADYVAKVQQAMDELNAEAERRFC